MRLLLKFSPGERLLPFAYQDAQRGVLHHWLGANNKEHDAPRSFYGFSGLLNLRAVGRQGLRPTTETVDWLVGFHEAEAAGRFIAHATQIRRGLLGMYLEEIAIQPEPMGLPDTFRVLSPVFLKVRSGTPTRVLNASTFDHLVPSDPDHAEALTAAFRRKLAAAGLSAEGLEMCMAEPFRTKLIKINETMNRCAVSPVTISGTDEQKRFARNVGVGHSTGCGFGFLE